MTKQKQIVAQNKLWRELVRQFGIDCKPKNERRGWFDLILGINEGVLDNSLLDNQTGELPDELKLSEV